MARDEMNEERDRVNGLIYNQRTIRNSINNDIRGFTSDIRAHQDRISHIRGTITIMVNIAAVNMSNVNAAIENIIMRLETGMIRSSAPNESTPLVISFRENRERDSETDSYLQNARWSMDSEISALESKIGYLESSVAMAQGRVDAVDAEIRRLTNLQSSISVV